MIKRLFAILVVMLASLSVKTAAQEETYRFDFGAQAGMSGYLGDASSSIFSASGFCGRVIVPLPA